MSERLPGLKGEFLWEFDIAEKQLMRLVDAFPEDQYGWRVGEASRTVSEIVVHVATGKFMLLGVIGIETAPDLYGELPIETSPRMLAMISVNDHLAGSVRTKAAVVALLKRSLGAVRTAFTESTDAELERSVRFFGEQTTVRRVYLRALAHLHEHMGQLIAYARAMGLSAPWPDWRHGAKHLRPEQSA